MPGRAAEEQLPLVTFADESSPPSARHPSYTWHHASLIIVCASAGGCAHVAFGVKKIKP